MTSGLPIGYIYNSTQLISSIHNSLIFLASDYFLKTNISFPEIFLFLQILSLEESSPPQTKKKPDLFSLLKQIRHSKNVDLKLVEVSSYSVMLQYYILFVMGSSEPYICRE